MSEARVVAYWGDRRESSTECADRLWRLLQRLAVLDGSFEQWFLKACSKSAASRPVQNEPTHLEQLLIQGRTRRDDDNSIIEDLGFDASFWNGQEPSVGFRATLGLHSGVRGLLNNVIINLPKFVEAPGLYEQSKAVSMLAALIDTMEPSWATWTTHEWRQAQQGQAPAGVPTVGWVTYLGESVTAQNWPSHSDLFSPEDSRVVLAAQDYSTVTDETILDLRQTLIEAGMLQ